MTTLLDTTTRSLHRIALGKQREGRVPGLFAAVCRGGRLLWGTGIGAAAVGDPDRAPGADDQFLIASNTKTFTAVMVMMLRDEGRLSLDDLLGEHVPEASHPITIRQCLAHASGMAREPLGDVWETLEQPDAKTLRRDFDEVERILRPHERWHYSNVVYAMLGQLVEELDSRPWEESLRTRLLEPLEMRRTTVGLEGAHVTGYYVPPYDDVPRQEPVLDLKAMVPCGGLASTADDLARWSAFVADPSALLSADTMEEMCQPQIMLNPDQWTGAMGLGFFLIRSSTGRTWVGHTGGMPGHITGVFTHRESGTGGLALMNSSTPPAPDAFAIELADHVLENDPVDEDPWRPGSEVPEEFRPLLGRWFSEGSPFVFSVAQGRLEARIDLPDAAKLPPSVFEKVSDDVYRTTKGRERGELLRVTRNADGSVAKLNWATYLFTREPIAFGEHLST